MSLALSFLSFFGIIRPRRHQNYKKKTQKNVFCVRHKDLPKAKPYSATDHRFLIENP
jgi:hypothetical protein